MHRGREDVVGRLAEIDVVVGMHQPCLAARPAEQFGGAIGEHFVEVHVALRARAGLPHRQGELVRMRTGQHFIGSRNDCPGFFRIEQAQIAINDGAGALGRGQRHDDFVRNALGRNVKKQQRALRLRTPQPVSGNLDGAE